MRQTERPPLLLATLSHLGVSTGAAHTRSGAVSVHQRESAPSTIHAHTATGRVLHCTKQSEVNDRFWLPLRVSVKHR